MLEPRARIENSMTMLELDDARTRRSLEANLLVLELNTPCDQIGKLFGLRTWTLLRGSRIRKKLVMTIE